LDNFVFGIRVHVHSGTFIAQSGMFRSGTGAGPGDTTGGSWGGTPGVGLGGGALGGGEPTGPDPGGPDGLVPGPGSPAGGATPPALKALPPPQLARTARGTVAPVPSSSRRRLMLRSEPLV